MKILRFLLQGWKRQDIADTLFLSIKTIEKRLTELRTQYFDQRLNHGLKAKPMEQLMAETGLSAFLLGNPDWFSESGYHWQI